jgi:CrcB protein
MHVLWQIGLVALGSACGGLLRWSVGEVFAFVFPVHPETLPRSFPWSTFVINVTGSLFLGWFYKFTEWPDADCWLKVADLRLLLGVGVAGGYTTFSTFAFEGDRLIEHAEWLKSAAYIAGSVFIGLVALRLGILLAKM